MGKQGPEFWWLLGLEMTLFLSLPCWELTAPWAEPVSNPWRFAGSLIVGATVAMLACHVGPAAFAARFGERWHPLAWVLLLWLGAGYLEWILSGAQAVASVSARASFAVTAVFLVAVVAVAWVTWWWKPAAVGGILLGSGILMWALVTNWNGLSTRNPHYSADLPQFDWLIIKGMLLSAAPAVVIGWRIGRIDPAPKRIWLSGVVGVWLPLIVSVTMASLAVQAGANLYWTPSLFRGFNWALLGPDGRLEPVVMALTAWTLWWPALLSAICLRELGRGTSVGLIPTAVCLSICAMAWHPEGLFSKFATPAHELWAGSLVILGGIAGLFALRRGRAWLAAEQQTPR